MKIIKMVVIIAILPYIIKVFESLQDILKNFYGNFLMQ